MLFQIAAPYHKKLACFVRHFFKIYPVKCPRFLPKGRLSLQPHNILPDAKIDFQRVNSKLILTKNVKFLPNRKPRCPIHQLLAAGIHGLFLIYNLLIHFANQQMSTQNKFKKTLNRNPSSSKRNWWKPFRSLYIWKASASTDGSLGLHVDS